MERKEGGFEGNDDEDTYFFICCISHVIRARICSRLLPSVSIRDNTHFTFQMLFTAASKKRQRKYFSSCYCLVWARARENKKTTKRKARERQADLEVRIESRMTWKRAGAMSSTMVMLTVLLLLKWACSERVENFKFIRAWKKVFNFDECNIPQVYWLRGNSSVKAD